MVSYNIPYLVLRRLLTVLLTILHPDLLTVLLAILLTDLLTIILTALLLPPPLSLPSRRLNGSHFCWRLMPKSGSNYVRQMRAVLSTSRWRQQMATDGEGWGQQQHCGSEQPRIGA